MAEHDKTKAKLKVGFLVNAFAGIGGEAALKGSDGEQIRKQALAYSEKRRSTERVAVFFQALSHDVAAIDWYVAADSMGQQQCLRAGIEPMAIVGSYGDDTDASNTIEAAGLLIDAGIDVLVFVGGDGTARNIVDALALKGGAYHSFPCLGLPSGVKMQSAVFALSPYAAAEVVKSLLHSQLTHISEQDVRDIDEQALREGRVSSRYYGGLSVPAEARFMQNLKQGGVEVDDWVLDDIAEQLHELMQDEPDTLFLIGPGNTLAHFMGRQALAYTLVGFDAVQDGQLMQSDLNSKHILAALAKYHRVKVVLSPTGNQGFILGRGNQQLNVEVLEQLSKQQILIVATKSKLQSLDNRPLIVDCNNAMLKAKFSGFIPVITALNDSLLYPVSSSY